MSKIHTGASFNKENVLVKAQDFSERKIFECSEYDLDKLKELPTVDYKDVKEIDNPVLYNWYQVGTDKYSRFMYCSITKIKRNQTMGEFYGKGLVD
jgi:hypothetical protein